MWWYPIKCGKLQKTHIFLHYGGPFFKSHPVIWKIHSDLKITVPSQSGWLKYPSLQLSHLSPMILSFLQSQWPFSTLQSLLVDPSLLHSQSRTIYNQFFHFLTNLKICIIIIQSGWTPIKYFLVKFTYKIILRIQTYLGICLSITLWLELNYIDINSKKSLHLSNTNSLLNP